MTAEEVVRTRLLDISAVTTLVGQRVYTLILPQSVISPAIRVQRISEDEVVHLRGAGKLRRSRVQVDSVAASAASAFAVDAAVMGNGGGSGLSGWTGTAGAAEVKSILPAGVRNEYEAGEVKLFKVMRDVFVVWQEA